MVNYEKIRQALKNFDAAKPFPHVVIDDFFDYDLAKSLEKEFPAIDSDVWYVYDNKVEKKNALNQWSAFPETTYKTFTFLMSRTFVDLLSTELNLELLIDPGLHGGGWHMHGGGGNLNPHLDYSIHPFMRQQRKLNLIIYLSSTINSEIDGGHLGFWAADTEGNPGDLVVELSPIFNRAVLFDTTKLSWHGMSRLLRQRPGLERKSIAVYYLQSPDETCTYVERALFAPRSDQRDDPEIYELIKKRSDSARVSKTYKTPK